ncbi:MAG: M23 family metallopeptidase [Ilumatobacteraceae bacterium]|nr:M23 family metallopeptidase [Ilumatobacteraceae bacterium]
MNHASPVPKVSTRSVGWFVVTLALVVGASAVAASPGAIDRAAHVSSPAERIFVAGEGLTFPIDPLPRCEVFDNFGGHSKAFGSGGHQGLDIGADLGQEVYAVEDGTLYRQFTDVSSSAGLGWGLWSTTDVKYRYYHLDGFAEGLAVGDEVVAGQLIGYVGDTGNASPGGWHLHFEVRPGPHPRYGSAAPVDPVPLLAIPSICNVY